MHFYAATHEKWLRDRTDEALKSGLPIFVSESAGMEASGDGKMDYKAWQEYIDWMEQRGLSWIVWSISDKDETCSMLKKSANSEGKWKDEDLKESGLKTREYLRFYNKGKN
jgi:endoglucanase